MIQEADYVFLRDVEYQATLRRGSFTVTAGTRVEYLPADKLWVADGHHFNRLLMAILLHKGDIKIRPADVQG